jgi:hypothetical protein
MEIISNEIEYKEECKICGPCIIGCFCYFITCIYEVYSFLNYQN